MGKKKTKIGRPKKAPNEVRNIILKIRLSKDEHRDLETGAQGELSTWARDVLLRAASRRQSG